jgi:hypothetical protein
MCKFQAQSAFTWRDVLENNINYILETQQLKLEMILWHYLLISYHFFATKHTAELLKKQPIFLEVRKWNGKMRTDKLTFSGEENEKRGDDW